MTKSPNEQFERDDKVDEERSLKSTMYNSIIFVGGGLVFFWLILFLTYKRG